MPYVFGSLSALSEHSEFEQLEQEVQLPFFSGSIASLIWWYDFLHTTITQSTMIPETSIVSNMG